MAEQPKRKPKANIVGEDASPKAKPNAELVAAGIRYFEQMRRRFVNILRVDKFRWN